MVTNRSYGRSQNLCFALALAIILVGLTPYVLSKAFWNDDALNSQIYYGLSSIDLSLLDASNHIVLSWLNEQGRPMIGFYLGYSLFYILKTPLLVKFFNCALIVLDIFLYSYLLKKLKVSPLLILLWGVIFVGLFQVNIVGFDPIASFAFHYPILFLQLIVPLLLFVKWMETLKKQYLFASLMLWLFFMMVYEINVIFIPIAYLISRVQKNDQSKLTVSSLIFVLIIYFFIFGYLRLRLQTGVSYDGSSFGQLSSFSKAYTYQLLSTIPLTGYLRIYSEYGLGQLVKDIISSKLALIAFFLMATFIWLISSKKQFEDQHYSIKPLPKEAFLISLLMIVLPPIFPAISARYQLEVQFGNPSLMIFYQWVGLSFFAAYYFSKAINAEYFRIFLTITMSFYFASNLTINTYLINKFDRLKGHSAQLFTYQLQNGFLSEVKDGDIVKFEGTPLEVNESLIFKWTNKRVYNPNSLTPPKFQKQPALQASLFVIRLEGNSYVATKIK